MDVNNFIKTIRESFGSSIVVYTMGNCYQFYEILKVVFPDAEPYYSGGHVFTKIGDKFYDINGEQNMTKIDAYLLTDDEQIKGLCVNKWPDENRKQRSFEMMTRTVKRQGKKPRKQ